MGGLGTALSGAASAVGSGVKAAGADYLNTAKNALFDVRHPKTLASGDAAPNPTDAYQDTTMGKLFGAGQPEQETPAQKMRRNSLTNY